jgi:hypothetical protein
MRIRSRDREGEQLKARAWSVGFDGGEAFGNAGIEIGAAVAVVEGPCDGPHLQAPECVSFRIVRDLAARDALTAVRPPRGFLGAFLFFGPERGHGH